MPFSGLAVVSDAKEHAMKLKPTVFILLMGATAAIAETHVSIGVRVGGGSGYYTPPPQAGYGYRPSYQQDYGWTDGYYRDKHWRKEAERRERERRKAWREEERRREKVEREWYKHQRGYERDYRREY